jgi:hypothetical protein
MKSPASIGATTVLVVALEVMVYVAPVVAFAVMTAACFGVVGLALWHGLRR